MERILVTGANGQLGSEIRHISSAYPFEFLFTDVLDLDITQKDQVHEYLIQNRVTAIVNCAAYTAVDRAEVDDQVAGSVNRLAVRILAEAAKECQLKMIHISTDYVFDGESFKPYQEEDTPNPKNIYGATKLEGEREMINLQVPNSIIIRTSWVYSVYGNNFVKTMLRLGKEKPEIRVVNDQVGTPTNARDLAKFVLDVLPTVSTSETEVYHFSNEGVCSWYDFAMSIMEMSSLTCKVNPIPSSSYPTPAKRPFYSVLSKQKIKRDFGVQPDHWRVTLRRCLEELH